MSVNITSSFQKANSPDEMLDLVDENDQVIGQVVRAQANADPNLWHREVGIIVQDSQSRILLQKRSHQKTVNPGMWSICAGHVPLGGEPEKVAHQELREEYGFDVSLQFLRKELHLYPWETHFMYLYLAKYTGQKIDFEPAEIEEVRFFSQKDFQELVKSDEPVNEHYFEVLGEVWKKL